MRQEDIFVSSKRFLVETLCHMYIGSNIECVQIYEETHLAKLSNDNREQSTKVGLSSAIDKYNAALICILCNPQLRTQKVRQLFCLDCYKSLNYRNSL